MCTAISFKSKDHYFGRNLDLEYSYLEEVTITPRNYPFNFKLVPSLKTHYALIGMAFVSDDYPLYYDATNEKGLSMAGLNFPNNACYFPAKANKNNVASFEFIPYILGQCATIKEVKALLKKLNLVNLDFSDTLKASPLHWLIADENSAICVEQTKNGLKVYDDEMGVLTNNPPFDYHLLNLANYQNVTREEVKNNFANNLKIESYSRGMGSIGLPGDLSSSSRFVKATFTKLNSICLEDEVSSVSQFFHILASVEQQNGCCRVHDKFEYTIYSSCCNTTKGIYYYKTYNNSQINAINLHNVNLDANKLITYQLITYQQFNYQN